MSLATGSHTVLIYQKIQFKTNWTRSALTAMHAYTANDDRSILIVVTESNPGAYTSYEFHLKKDMEVWINYAENTIHIPVLCTSSKTGDVLAKCG